MGAGATSALISCPAELIMIQQQMHGTTLASAFRTFLQEHGILRMYRGLVRVHRDVAGAVCACQYMIYGDVYAHTTPCLLWCILLQLSCLMTLPQPHSLLTHTSSDTHIL